MNTLAHIRSILYHSINIPENKASYFFKTGAGHYAEHDIFIGVTVPTVRKIAQQFAQLPLHELQALLESKINEERLLALIILTQQYKRADSHNRETIYQFYLKNLEHVNNWNLVDTSAHLIIGAHLLNKDRSSLIEVAQSPTLWERRIAIVSTWYFIRNNDLEWTFTISQLLLNDTHDLIHKAVGWMLRETGKKDEAALVKFLDAHSQIMPRTMLRYAIEKFPEEQRQEYLKRTKTQG